MSVQRFNALVAWCDDIGGLIGRAIGFGLAFVLFALVWSIEFAAENASKGTGLAWQWLQAKRAEYTVRQDGEA